MAIAIRRLSHMLWGGSPHRGLPHPVAESLDSASHRKVEQILVRHHQIADPPALHAEAVGRDRPTERDQGFGCVLGGEGRGDGSFVRAEKATRPSRP